MRISIRVATVSIGMKLKKTLKKKNLKKKTKKSATEDSHTKSKNLLTKIR
jgi:hypothetical protein